VTPCRPCHAYTRRRKTNPDVKAVDDEPLIRPWTLRVSTTTVSLGRLLGLYPIAISVGTLVNKRRTLATLHEMARSGLWMLFSGMGATAAGLAIVLGHNVWTGGALAVVITLFGWAALLKGVSLLLVPPEQMAAATRAWASIGFSTPGWSPCWRSAC
jgi:hypothetical protein